MISPSAPSSSLQGIVFEGAHSVEQRTLLGRRVARILGRGDVWRQRAPQQADEEDTEDRSR